MTATLALYALVGLALVAAGGRLGHRSFLVGLVPLAVSTAWAGSRLGSVVDGNVDTESVTWVGQLGLSLDLRLDGLAETMTLVVAGIGVLVTVYAARYFDPTGPGGTTPDLGRLAGLLVLFAGAMVGLVQADHLLLLYTCWELTSITSYLLIGNRHTDPTARAAALHALIVTGGGGLAMLGGFVLLARESGTYRLSELADGLAASGDLDRPAVTAAVVLILLGAFTKSAQYPFHAWLPGAMAAPTPVSAYLHSATMVKAGVYLIARLAPVFASVTVWRPAVLVVGAVTLVAAGLRALRQHDLKLLLAFGTVSQLGLMVVLFGAGTPAATTAGWVLLVSHALFKAALFMVVGVLDHQAGTRDLHDMPVLGPGWWWLKATAAVSLASMAGVPLLAGFVSKEAAYEALADAPLTGGALVLTAAVGGSMLTVAYGARFYLGAFVLPARRAAAAEQIRREPAVPGEPPTPLAAISGGPQGPTSGPSSGQTSSPVHDGIPAAAPSLAFGWPAALLAAGSVVLGVAPWLEDGLATASLRSLGGGTPVHLAVWHGWNLALALSAVTLVGGVLVVLVDRRAQRLLAAGGALPSGRNLYATSLRGLGRTSRSVTGVVQNGSLPVYCGVILATAAILPAAALVARWEWPGWPRFTTLGDVPVAGMLLLAAFGAASIRRRFSAALFLGAAGYSMAALFVVSGAPDLALTQAVVETLSTVVFVLVLRRLPEKFERQSTQGRRAVRLVTAGLVGVTVFVLAIVAGGSAAAPTVSDEMVARSVPDGHGQNVVNVILVDFRALDTLGEIFVLAVASIGAVALARVGRRAAEQRTGSDPAPAPESRATMVNRIVFVDVSVQLIFHVVLLASLWLLFAGHNQPGGGFVGGLLAGSAITLRYVAGGIDEVRANSRFRPWTVLGAGVLLATATATFPLLSGGAVLDVASQSVALPALGTLKLSSALAFDVGVYLTVVGMVLMAFEAFGDEPAEAVR